MPIRSWKKCYLREKWVSNFLSILKKKKLETLEKVFTFVFSMGITNLLLNNKQTKNEKV